MGDQPVYECPVCKAKSYNPNDIKYGYCNACHAFTRDCVIGLCRKTPVEVFGNVAACAEHAEGLQPSHKET